MRKIKSLVCILLALTMVFSLAACGGGSDQGGASTPSTPSTPSPSPSSPSGPTPGPAAPTDQHIQLTIGVSDFLGRFIQGLVPTEGAILTNAVFDQILNIDPKTKQRFSDCLEDWYYEDDVTLIMKLKPNVYFSNGMHATAEDVLYSYSSKVDWGSTMVPNFGPLIWDECYARDEYTVQFKWEKPYRVFLNTRMNLICKEWALSLPDGSEDLAWYDPVGSGPYAVKQFVHEDVCVLTARDDYWNKDVVGPAYVDQWTIKFYKDASTMYMDLEVGNLDFAEAQPTDFSRYVKGGGGGDGFDCFMVTVGCTQYFTFSFDDFPAWNDKRLREAVAIGMDWEQLGRAAYDELYIPADSIMPKASPLHVTPGKYEYNPERAKQLLAEAGYGPGNPLKLTTTLMDSQLYKALGENSQFQLSQLGIQLELEYLDIMSAINVWNNPGGTDIGFWWNINGSAAFDLFDITPNACVPTGSTYLHVYDPKFVELWTTMRDSIDEAKVAQAVKEIQQVNFDEILYIPYYEFSGAFGYRTDKFTEQQLKDFIIGVNNYQIGRLGLLSAWQ